jgi:hypothetical protein
VAHSGEHVQSIVSIAFERMPKRMRESFQRTHDQAIVTRVIKERTTRGHVTYDVYFVNPDGRQNHAILPGMHMGESTKR